MNHLDQTPEERVQGMRNRAALAAFIIVAILAAAFIAFAPSSHANSHASSHVAIGESVSRETKAGAASVKRCQEDQVISRRASCLDRDDHTTRYRVVSEAGWGYWVDTRYPRAMSMRPLVVACYKWQQVTRYSGCVAPLRGDFRGGWWYHR